VCRKGRVLDDDALIADLGLEEDDILIATLGKSCYTRFSTALLVLLSAFVVRSSIRQAETCEINTTLTNAIHLTLTNAIHLCYTSTFFVNRPDHYKHKTSYIYGRLTSPKRWR
jgi:hypothetical protein